jgi:uncharacterized protein
VNRVVLDTNVIISALFWTGPPRDLYNLVQENKIIMLLSEDMEREFIRVLGYSKFGLSAQEILPLVTHLRNNAELVRPAAALSVITADPTDNIFLECAADGQADYIISGDKHLLDLGSYRGIPITGKGFSR